MMPDERWNTRGPCSSARRNIGAGAKIDFGIRSKLGARQSFLKETLVTRIMHTNKVSTSHRDNSNKTAPFPPSPPFSRSTEPQSTTPTCTASTSWAFFCLLPRLCYACSSLPRPSLHRCWPPMRSPQAARVTMRERRQGEGRVSRELG